MTALRWDKQSAAAFPDLIRLIPGAVLNSPKRSVIPLVDMFRDPSLGIRRLERLTGLITGGDSELVFESAFEPPLGRGKPSYTDLLVLGPDISIAIEAKFTEPRYETAREWLGSSPSENRRSVLDGWLQTISKEVARPLSAETVADLPYQLVHRAASAVATGRSARALVYLVFGSAAEHYASDLNALWNRVGNPGGFSVHLVTVPVSPTAIGAELISRWDAGERKLAEDVRHTLLMGPMFALGDGQQRYTSRAPELAI